MAVDDDWKSEIAAYKQKQADAPSDDWKSEIAAFDPKHFVETMRQADALDKEHREKSNAAINAANLNTPVEAEKPKSFDEQFGQFAKPTSGSPEAYSAIKSSPQETDPRLAPAPPSRMDQWMRGAAKSQKSEEDLPVQWDHLTYDERESYLAWQKAYKEADSLTDHDLDQGKMLERERAVAATFPKEHADKLLAAVSDLAEEKKDKNKFSFPGRAGASAIRGASDLNTEISDTTGIPAGKQSTLSLESQRLSDKIKSAREQQDPLNPYGSYDPRGWIIGTAGAAPKLAVAAAGGPAGALAFTPGMYREGRREGYSPLTSAVSAGGQTLLFSGALKAVLPAAGAAESVEQKLSQSLLQRVGSIGKNAATGAAKSTAMMTLAEAYNQAVQETADIVSKQHGTEIGDRVQRVLEAGKSGAGMSILLSAAHATPELARAVIDRAKDDMVSKADMPDANRKERIAAYGELTKAIHQPPEQPSGQKEETPPPATSQTPGNAEQGQPAGAQPGAGGEVPQEAPPQPEQVETPRPPGAAADQPPTNENPVDSSAAPEASLLDDARGIKNAYTKQRRIEEDFSPRDPVGRRAWEETKQKVQSLSDEDMTSRIDELRTRDLSKNPPNEFDGWVLGRRTNEIENQLMQARASGDQQATVASQHQLADILDIDEKAGTEPARTLAMRRAMWDKDFSLVGVARKWIKAKKGPLSEAEWKRVGEISDGIDKAQNGGLPDKDTAKVVEDLKNELAESRKSVDELKGKLESRSNREETVSGKAQRVQSIASQLGVDSEDLRQQAVQLAETKNGDSGEHRKQIAAIQKDTGLSPKKLADYLESGQDPEKYVLPNGIGIDKYLQSAHEEYPGLLREETTGSELFDLLGEKSRDDVDWAHPDNLREAAKKLASDEKIGSVQKELWDVPSRPEDRFDDDEDTEDQGSKKPTQRQQAKSQRKAAGAEFSDAIAKLRKAAQATGPSGALGGGAIDLINAGIDVVKAGVKLGIATVQEMLAALRELVPEDEYERLKPSVEKAWHSVAADNSKEKIGKRFEKDGTITNEAVRELAKAIIGGGVHGVEDVSKAVHDALKEIDPSITRLESNDLLSGRGKVRLPSDDPIDKELTDIKRQRSLIDNIEGMKKTPPESPLGMGFKRQEPTDTERNLRAEFNEEKKRHPELMATEENQLKSASQAREKALENFIKDKLAEIDKGIKNVKERRPLDMTPKIKALEAEAARVKELWDAKFPKTAEERAAAQMRGLDRAIEMQADDLSKGKIRPEQKKTAAWSAEMESKKARLAALRALRDEARSNDPDYQKELSDKKEAGKQKRAEEREIEKGLQPSEDARRLATYKRMLSTREADLLQQKAEMERTGVAPTKAKKLLKTKLDAAANKQKRQVERLRQEVTDTAAALRENMAEKIGGFATSLIESNVLSSLTIIPKIAAAVGWKIPGMIKDEIVRMALSKIPGFREFAGPVEGQGSPLEYIKKLGNISAIARNSADQLLYHGTLSHADFGEVRVRPGWATPKPGASKAAKVALAVAREYTEIPGKSHASVKELLRTPAELLARSKLEADGREHGEDVDDPEVKERIGQFAYDWSNRQILMQKSEGANQLRGLATAKVDPKTGHKTVPGIIKEVVGKGVLPVVRVGMNAAAELLERSTGLVEGASRLAWQKMIHGDLMALPEEAREAIARKIVYGVSSLPAMFLIGWFGYKHFGGYYGGQKTKKGELGPGEIEFGGHVVPHEATHSPEIGVSQAAAMLHKLLNERGKNGSLKYSTTGALIGTGAGILGTTPLASEAQTIARLSSTTTAGKAAEQLLSTMIVPAWMKFIASKIEPQKKK